MHGGPGTAEPGQITWTGPLRSLMVVAYGLRNYQVSGPAWLSTEQFTIVAKAPADSSPERIQEMWQSLLANRFHVKLHFAMEDVPVYELTIDRNGAKLKESPPDRPASADPPRYSPGPDGCPVSQDGRRGYSTAMLAGRYRICAARMTIPNLLAALAGSVDLPIVDRTGLTGKYDFKLEFQMPGSTEEDFPTVRAALPLQLGLRLDPKKAPARMLIVDSAEKIPTEN